MNDTKILVAEGNKTSQLLTILRLKHAGIDPKNISQATNGAEVIGKATTELYSLIIMDLELPVVDSKEAAKIIRDYYKKSATPETSPKIIACTVLQETRHDTTLQEMFDDVILHPVETEEKFITRILNVLNKQGISN